MRILVTGFEPFGQDSENASAEAVGALGDAWARSGRSDVEVVTGLLPVSFARAGTVLAELLARHTPDAVLAVGEAGGRGSITPERWAHNLDDARIPDNDGNQPRESIIDPAGPGRRGSGFDVEAQVAALLDAGLPAAVSDDAGRYLCNHVAYLVAGLDVPGGFVHVPAVRARGTATVGAETDAHRAVTPTTLSHAELARGLAVLMENIARPSGA